MTLDNYRPHVAGIVTPVARTCVKIGLTPNACTILAFIAAVIAGAFFYEYWIIAGVVFVFLNAFFDAIDGAVAREMNAASLRGDFLDHVLDRYADIFIICGIFGGSLAPWQIGVFALTGVLMSSYLGTQAQAVGAGRYYGGVLGRADRLVLLIGGGLVTVLIPAGVYGMSILGWVLVIFGFLGHFTAIQRFAHVWRELKR
jgi:archaetidylinositol phosphate synthase